MGWSGRIFDVSSQGLATYVLALAYLLVALTAAIKLRRLNQFVRSFTSTKLLPVFVTVHVWMRAISFSLLCVFSVFSLDIWYPFLVLLFTIPEFFILSTYQLLFFNWLELYILAHDQFLIVNQSNFRNTWNVIFFFSSIILYCLLCSLYALLMIKPSDYEDSVVTLILWITAIGDLSLPVLFFLACAYFGLLALSGFPFSSPAARERVRRLNWLFFVWTFGRVARGVLLIVSVADEWQTTLESLYLSMVIVSSLAISEFFPIMITLDWAFISQFIMATSVDDSLGLRTNAGYYEIEPTSDQQERHRWELDVSAIRVPDGVLESAEFSSFTRGTYNNRSVAINVFRFHDIDTSQVDELMSDLIEFSAVDHTHIVSFIGIARAGPLVFQLSELMSRGSLWDLIRQSKNHFEPIAIVRWCSEIASAMSYLHSRGQIHGYLTSKNILMDAMMSVKVGDAGVRSVKAYAEVMFAKRMANAWSAPEVLEGKPASSSSDVYSFGVIAWECVSRGIPYEGRDLSSIYTLLVKKQQRLRLPSKQDSFHLPDDFNKLVYRCLEVDERARPAFHEIERICQELLQDAVLTSIAPAGPAR